MIKLNTNFLDTPYADIMLENSYLLNSYNINATSDYFSYIYKNLLKTEDDILKATTTEENKTKFTYSYLALHDSILLNNIALNNKCVIYKRVVKNNKLYYISWKNWFNQLYLQNDKILSIVNSNKIVLTKDSSNIDKLELLTEDAITGLIQNQSTLSYNYLNIDLGLEENTISQIANFIYAVNGYSSQETFMKDIKENKHKSFLITTSALSTLKNYSVNTKTQQEQFNTSNISQTVQKENYENYTFEDVEYYKRIKTLNRDNYIPLATTFNINSSFAESAYTDIYNGRSIISRDLLLDDRNDLSYQADKLDLNVSKFVDIIPINSSFKIGMDLTIQSTQDAVKELVKDIKDNIGSKGILGGLRQIAQGIVSFLPGGKLISAITQTVATLAGIAQGLGTNSSILNEFSNSVSNYIQNTLTNGIKLASPSSSTSSSLLSQQAQLSSAFVSGNNITSGVSSILSGINDIVHGGTALAKNIDELSSANRDGGQTGTKYVNWVNFTKVIKAESSVDFYSDTIRFNFALGQFGIFNTIEEVIKPCLNLLALVQPSKIEKEKLFGPYFTIESLLMKTGISDLASSFLRSWLNNDTQIESSIFFKDFWDISIGPGIHFYNCIFTSLNIDFSTEKDQNGIPIKAECSLSFTSQTPKSILSVYTSQVSFRFGTDINLIDLYNSIPTNIPNIVTDSFRTSTLQYDTTMSTLPLTQLFPTFINSKNSEEIPIKYVDDYLRYYIKFRDDIDTIFFKLSSKEKNSLSALSKNSYSDVTIDLLQLTEEIKSLKYLADSYVKLFGISPSEYSNIPLTFGFIQPIHILKKTSKGNIYSNLNVNVIGKSFENYKEYRVFTLLPKDLKDDDIKQIIEGVNNNSLEYFSNDSCARIIPTYMRLHGLLVDKVKYVNNITYSQNNVLYYRRVDTTQSKFEYKKLENIKDSKDIVNHINDLPQSVNMAGCIISAFNGNFNYTQYDYQSHNTISTSSSPLSTIYLSDIYTLYDLISYRDSVKSPKLQLIASKNLLDEKENIFYNKNRDTNKNNSNTNKKNNPNTYVPQVTEKNGIIQFNNSSLNSLFEIDKFKNPTINKTTRCMSFSNKYGGYIYGYDRSLTDSSFLDIYREQKKEETTETTSSNNTTTTTDTKTTEEKTSRERVAEQSNNNLGDETNLFYIINIENG